MFSSKVLFALFCVLVCCETIVRAQVMRRGCDPRLDHRGQSQCPDGYCCVRDEFLPMETFCKRIGVLDDNCTTRLSESECPCEEGLTCRPNINSATFTSLYGSCVNATVTDSD